jgi:hypothetical protein
MKNYLTIITLSILLFVSCQNSAQNRKANFLKKTTIKSQTSIKNDLVSDCDFTGSFSDEENGGVLITISKDGNVKINGDNGILKNIKISFLSDRYGSSINNIICAKDLSGWLLIKVSKQEKPFDSNTKYYLDQGFLRPIYKIK